MLKEVRRRLADGRGRRHRLCLSGVSVQDEFVAGWGEVSQVWRWGTFCCGCDRPVAGAVGAGWFPPPSHELRRTMVGSSSLKPLCNAGDAL